MATLTLRDVLDHLCGPISEEQAWALLYHVSCKCHETPPLRIDTVTVTITLEGQVALEPNVILDLSQNDVPHDLVSTLGFMVYMALDRDVEVGMERVLSSDLERLISDMVRAESEDEGIGHEVANPTFPDVIQCCKRHLKDPTAYYQTVLKEMVYNAVEGLHDKCSVIDTGTDYVYLVERCRLWGRVMEELRKGIQLRRVTMTDNHQPRVFELTPYELLMRDIRTCRHKLRKVIQGENGQRRRLDQHDVLLEWIRSRPPLKNAADRQLPPPLREMATPREQLLNSIKRGTTLKPTPKPRSIFTQKRRLKADRSILNDLYDDLSCAADDNLSTSSSSSPTTSTIDVYDLAVTPQTVDYKGYGSGSVPSTRPNSRQSDNSTDNESLVVVLPSHVIRALSIGVENIGELPFEDRLAFTLSDLTHVRCAITTAELETLSVEADIRHDAATNKICFLCLKTRFTVLGPWGRKCGLCKRTICNRCCDRISVTRQQFAQTPVALLNPVALTGFGRGEMTPPDSALKKLQSSASLGLKKHLNRLHQMVVCNDCKLLIFQLMKSVKMP